MSKLIVSPKWHENDAEIQRRLRNPRESQQFWEWSVVEATMHIRHDNAMIRAERAIIGDDVSPAQTVHQLFHMHVFNTVRPQVPYYRTIAEFGGGYGMFASLLAAERLITGGDYYMFDLPGASQLQQLFIGRPPLYNFRWFTSGQRVPQAELAVALFSITEAPLDARDEWLDEVQPQELFVAMADRYDGIDNLDWWRRTVRIGGFEYQVLMRHPQNKSLWYAYATRDYWQYKNRGLQNG